MMSIRSHSVFSFDNQLFDDCYNDQTRMQIPNNKKEGNDFNYELSDPFIHYNTKC